MGSEMCIRDRCQIDHTVGPVAHTTGGSTPGYARWERFRDRRLGRYARDRNDPLRAGVSRMSPYLHFGMVSPFRIAREARAQGADKFLDELLVWRELGYNFARFAGVDDAWAALPDWARATLESRSEPSEVLDIETLSRGRTGDSIWDVCQQSLRSHGELHNLSLIHI